MKYTICNFTCLLVILSFTLISCEKTIEYNGPHKDPVLVLQSILIKNDTIKVNISKTAFFTDNSENYYIDNAQVEMSINGANYLPLSSTNFKGNYISNRRIQENDELSIRASVPNFNSIYATDKMPIDADIDAKLLSIAPDTKEVRCELTINDPNIDNFYLINVEYCYISTNEFMKDTINVTNFHSTDPILQNSNKFFSQTIPYFDDEAFNGKSHTFTLISGTDDDDDDDYIFNSPSYYLHTISIECSNLSRAAYKYLKFYKLADSTNDNPFSEPTQMFSNVKNGYGILGMRSVTKKTILIK